VTLGWPLGLLTIASAGVPPCAVGRGDEVSGNVVAEKRGSMELEPAVATSPSLPRDFEDTSPCE
jgi:hypothetical protein